MSAVACKWCKINVIFWRFTSNNTQGIYGRSLRSNISKEKGTIGKEYNINPATKLQRKIAINNVFFYFRSCWMFFFFKKSQQANNFPFFFNGKHSLTDTFYVHYRYTKFLFDRPFFSILLPTKATDFIFLIFSRFKHKWQELRQSLIELCMKCWIRKMILNSLTKKSLFNLT